MNVDQDNSLIGEFLYDPSNMYNNKFKFNDVILIQHKCNSCGGDQNWDKGNNYNDLWVNRNVFK